MAKTDTAPDSALEPRQRVTLTRDIRGVPEGTGGQIKVISGLTWTRYWVQFDNGPWVGSVSGADLVPEEDWESFQVRRAEEALRPKTTEVATETPGDATAAPAGAAANSRVPAHLLERSQKARARKAGSAE